ncbi:MAG: hypothetical protein E6Q83_08115 [Thiothrix sp.]|nr:MAG: hypothetical protein E6Q83_08115 [Thiothrix sp.]
MHVLSFQLSALGIGLFLLGLGVGWWAAHFFQQYIRTACAQELARLRYAHQRLQQDFNTLSQQATHCEHEKAIALTQLAQSTDVKAFEQIRLQLLHARNQLRETASLLAKRERQLHRLNDRAKLLKKQLMIPAPIVNQAYPHAATEQTHALNCIQGLDTNSLQKLQMLGILTCEQLATCSTEQLRLMQRLISDGKIIPFATWVKAARLLVGKSHTNSTLAQ